MARQTDLFLQDNKQESLLSKQNVDQQVLDASATGGVTKLAEDPTQDRIQLAGGGGITSSLLELLKAANIMGGAREGVEQAPEEVMGRVPTPIEQRLGKGKDIQATKDYYARQLLTPERYKSFKSRGFSAADANEEQVLKKAREALETDLSMEGVPLSQDMLRMTTGEDAITVRKNPKTKKGKVIIGGDLDFNFEKINTSDDIKKVIQATSKIYRKQTDAAVGGKVTLDQTKEEASQLLANELGITKKALQKNRGLLDAAESTALRSLLVNSASKIDELTKKINGIGPNGEEIAKDRSTATMFAFRRQMALHAGLQIAAKKQQADLARALSSYRIDVGSSLQFQDKLMDDVIKSGGGYEETEKLAKGVQKALKEGGGAGLNTFVDKATAYGNAAYEIYINGLLSGPKTFFKNALGTPLFMTYLLAEDTIAATYGAIERGGKKLFNKQLTPNDAEGIYLSQIAARVYGYIHAFRDAASNSVETLKTEASASAVGRVDSARFRAIDSQTLGLSGYFGAAVDFFGRITRIPGLALQSTDDFWKGIAQRAALYEEAVNRASKAKYLGKSNEEAAQDGIEVLLDPQSIAKDLDHAANYATLTSDTGALGKIARTIQNYPEKFPIGRLLMPFATVPTNVIARTVERSLFNVPAIKKIFTGTPKERSKSIAKLGLASSMFLYVSHLSTQGRITGALPRDKKEREMLPPGWQPFSLVFRGEDFPEDKPMYDNFGNPNGNLLYVSYAGLEPVGLIFALGANYVEGARRSRDINMHQNKAARYAVAMLDYIEEMPMINTFGTISKAFQEGDPSILYNSPVANFLGPIPKPMSSLFRNIKKLEDTEIKKKTEEFERFTAKDVYEDARKNNRYGADGQPFFENIGTPKNAFNFREVYHRIVTAQVGDEEREAQQYDVFGIPKTRGVKFSINPVVAMWNMITPFSISYGQKFTPLQEEIVRLRVPLSIERNTYKNLKLSKLQSSKWTEYAKNKQVLRKLTFREAIEKLFYSRAYSRFNDKQKQSAYRKIEQQYYNAAAEEFLLIQYPDLSEAIESRKFLLGGN